MMSDIDAVGGTSITRPPSRRTRAAASALALLLLAVSGCTSSTQPAPVSAPVMTAHRR